AAIRPAAGIVGLVSHPIRGAVESTRNTFGRKEDSPLRHIRISEGLHTVLGSTTADRATILRRFEEAKSQVLERRNAYEDMAKRFLEECHTMGGETSSRINPTSGLEIRGQ